MIDSACERICKSDITKCMVYFRNLIKEGHFYLMADKGGQVAITEYIAS